MLRWRIRRILKEPPTCISMVSIIPSTGLRMNNRSLLRKALEFFVSSRCDGWSVAPYSIRSRVSGPLGPED